MPTDPKVKRCEFYAGSFSSENKRPLKMEKLRKALEEWAKVKGRRDEIAGELEYKKTLEDIKQGIKNERTKDVLLHYKTICAKIKPVDEEVVSGYILGELKKAFKQGSTVQASIILQDIGDLNTEMFHRAKSLFVDYIAKTSLKYAKHSVADYISTLKGVEEYLDPKNSFRLKEFIHGLCMERLGVFEREARGFLEGKAQNTKKGDLLKIDKWIDQCTKILTLEANLGPGISSLYQEMVIFYLSSCIEHIILADASNGPEDLVFLAEKLTQRAERVQNLDLKDRIKEVSWETGILSTAQLEEIGKQQI